MDSWDDAAELLVELTQAVFTVLGMDAAEPGSIAAETMQFAESLDGERVCFLVKLLHERMDDGEWEESAFLLALLQACWRLQLEEDEEVIALCRELARRGAVSERIRLIGTLPTRGEWAGVTSVREMLAAAAAIAGGRGGGAR